MFGSDGDIPDYHGAEAYSALLVAADALERAESFSPADIREALDQTVMDTPFGPVKFVTYDNFERQNGVRTHLLQIQDGKFEVIWPPDIVTTPYAPDHWHSRKVNRTASRDKSHRRKG